MVEVDVRETGDGHLILLHDDLVDRTTNKTGPVAEMSLEQVQRLNAGEWQRIPSLEEALEVATGKVGMILELKVEGIGAEASSIVKRIGFNGSLMYASFLQQELMRVRQAEPGALMMMLMDEQLPKDPLADAVALRASHVGLHYSTVTPRLIQTCHNVGLQVFAYTVNSLEDIQKMKTLSLDGIISDFPDRI
jgi:glycerophosphoryl diester phosphodiesterase